jgi:hypothetical protein
MNKINHRLLPLVTLLREKIGEYYKNILEENSKKSNKHNIFKYYYFFSLSKERKDKKASEFLERELVEIVDFYEYKILNFIEETNTDKNSIDDNYIEALLINFIGLNHSESYDSLEFTSYEIVNFIEKLKKNDLVNIVGNFQCGSVLGAIQTLYLYSQSNPQRYLLTNNAKKILREGLSNPEFRLLTTEEFGFIHAENNFKENIDKLYYLSYSSSTDNSYLDSLIEKHINSF